VLSTSEIPNNSEKGHFYHVNSSGQETGPQQWGVLWNF